MSSKTLWDCVMIGAGPTALAAAIYTSREDLKTLLIEKAVVGGLAAITEKIDNYPGFAQGISGLELSQQLQKQAQRFGAQIELDEVVSFVQDKDIFQVKLASQKIILARSVLIATGSKYKQLGVKGESEFYGRGVHNCATCDGAFYRDKKLVVVGGGNSAAQESLFLTKFARQIDILIRKNAFKASDILVKDVLNHPKIKVNFSTKLLQIKGNEQNQVARVVIDKKGQIEDILTDGVFVFIGLLPVTDFLKKTEIVLDEQGFVVTDQDFRTNVAGIFCAGDVRQGATMQIASAVGEGASAALSIRHYLDS